MFSYSNFARFVYRFRTLAFHVSKTGSIPVPCTSFAAKDVTGCQVASTMRWYGFLALVQIQLAASVFIGRAAARLALKRPVELPGVPKQVFGDCPLRRTVNPFLKVVKSRHVERYHQSPPNLAR